MRDDVPRAGRGPQILTHSGGDDLAPGGMHGVSAAGAHLVLVFLAGETAHRVVARGVCSVGGPFPFPLLFRPRFHFPVLHCRFLFFFFLPRPEGNR